jgi:hypothetical protein
VLLVIREAQTSKKPVRLRLSTESGTDETPCCRPIFLLDGVFNHSEWEYYARITLKNKLLIFNNDSALTVAGPNVRFLCHPLRIRAEQRRSRRANVHTAMTNLEPVQKRNPKRPEWNAALAAG